MALSRRLRAIGPEKNTHVRNRQCGWYNHGRTDCILIFGDGYYYKIVSVSKPVGQCYSE